MSEQPTSKQPIESRIDTLIADFQRACETVVVRGDSHLSETTKHRAIIRNELRTTLLAVHHDSLAHWKRFAMQCMRFLTREQIAIAAKAAGTSVIFCEPSPVSAEAEARAFSDVQREIEAKR